MKLIAPRITNISFSNRNYYHEVDRSSNTLVITVGDSWTWGDALGKTTVNYDDYEYRTEHIYGNILSNAIGADFINLGFPGFDNMRIMRELLDIYPTLTRTYNKCYIIFTLTESGRELKNESRDRKDLVVELARSKSVDDFFIRYENWTFKTIQKNFNVLPGNIIWVVARNFTSVRHENLNTLPDSNLITTRWVDVISERGQLDPYPKKVDVLSRMGIDPIIKISRDLGLDNSKDEWIKIFNQSSQAMAWLENSPHNSQIATKHPLEQGHAWWAEFLLKRLT